MRPLLALSLVILSLTAACAPRMSKTHFDRWASETAKQKKQADEDEKVQAWLRAQAGVGQGETRENEPGGKKVTAGGGTQTSTSARSVVRPGATPATSDDESIY